MSSLSKQQEQGGDEPELSELELVPQSSNAKKTSKHRKPPATPAKGNKKNKTVADVSTPSTVSNASPAKSYTSISSTEEEGTPTETKAYGWFGTDARVFSSPLKGSSR